MKRDDIKAVIFDIGGVLELGINSSYSIKKSKQLGIHSEIAKKLNISIDQYLDAIDTTYADSIKGKISEKKAINIIAKNLKTSEKKLEKLYIKIYKKHFKKNKHLFKQAFKLRKKNYKISILSDQWPISKKALMSSRLYKKFNPIIISCDVGLRKPDKKIYKLILEKLNLKPSQTIFIDNQEWNIKPAKKLGINTILFNNNKQLFEQQLWRKLFEKK